MPGRISLEMMFSRTSYWSSRTEHGYCFSCDDSSCQPQSRRLTFPTITTNENKLLAAQEFSQIVVKKKRRVRLYVIHFPPWRLFYLLPLVHKDRNKLRNDSKCMGVINWGETKSTGATKRLHFTGWRRKRRFDVLVVPLVTPSTAPIGDSCVPESRSYHSRRKKQGKWHLYFFNPF